MKGGILMIEYSYYKNEYNGKLDQDIFDEICPKACDVMKMYIMGFLSAEDLKTIAKLDFNKAICYQIDFIENMGLGVIHGDRTERDIKSVSTSGFVYSYEDHSQYEFVGNIPISSIASAYVKNELRVNGYLNRIYKQCKDPQDF